MQKPEEITIANLEVLVMPNGEIISEGVTIGWLPSFSKNLTPVRNGITGEPINE